MKNILPVLYLFLIAIALQAQPNIQWQKSLGGNSYETAYATQQTSDGGYIIAGSAFSENNGDVWLGPGNGDFWVVKLDVDGEKEWQKAIGGSSTEVATSIQQTTDGGYIVAGRTYSNDFHVSGNHGDLDCWVVKLSPIGVIEWQRALGGSEDDLAESIRQTADGGYIMAGYTYSNDGDVGTNHVYFDGWLVKLSGIGAIEWQKSLGGQNGEDYAYSVRQTNDGGYILAGETNSTDTGLSGNHGNVDCWVAKVSADGHLEWQKAFGGGSRDVAHSISQTSEGGYILAGVATSYNSGQVSGSHGFGDIWVVKLSEVGEIQWQRSLGGSGQEHGGFVQQTSDGGYVVAGTTESTDGDVMNNDGLLDFWIVKLSSSGQIERQKTLGGTDVEFLYDVKQTNDGGYILVGNSRSNDGDLTGNHGELDMWVVKLSDFTSATENAPAFNKTGLLEIFPNPSNHSITLKIATEETIVRVTISDVLGKEVLRQMTPKAEAVDISTLSNGMYLVVAATASGKRYSEKLVKAE